MSKKSLLVVILLLIAIVGAAAVIVPRKSDKSGDPPVSTTPRKAVGVGARARIEPEDGVTVVAAPYIGGQPSLITDLRVKEGDWLKTGQVIAVLDSWASS